MTDRYFGQGGNNSNDGLSYANRKLTYANLSSGIVAGDTVYMCCNAAGLANRWTNTEQINVVSGSGLGTMVTYSVYPGHYVLMEVTTTGTNGAINGSGNQYVRIQPGDGFLEMGDDSDWDPDNWTSPGWTRYAARRQFNFVNCDQIYLVGTGTGVWSTTNSNFVVHGGSGYEGNTFDEDCDMVFLYGLDVSKHGTNNTGTYASNPNSDEGDMFCIYGTRFLVKNCCFKLGGHQNIAVKSRSTIIDTCDFDGDWDGFTPNADEGRGAPIERSGGRTFAIVAADAAHGANAPYGPTLVQNCIIQKAGSDAEQHDNPQAALDGRHIIFRRNYIWDGCDLAVRMATHNDFVDDSLGEVKVYNVTMYGNGRIMDIRSIDVFDNVYMQCDFINNICDEIKGSYYGVAIVKHFRRRATGEASEGYANGWKGGRYSANIAKMASGSPDGSTVTVEYRGFGGTNENYTWLTVDNAYPSNWSSNNVMGTSPTYQGDPSSGARTKNTFLPNGGIETGAADPHAIANGSGTNSSTLTVDSGQARMFCDGWNMGDFGVLGDWIKIGSGEPVRITAIDESTDEITLHEVRSWSDNDEVWWCTTDDGGANFTVYNDIGAGQTPISVESVPPNHSTKVMVFR